MSTEAKQIAAVDTADAAPSLLDEILSETKMKPSDDGYDVARRGVQAFIAQMLAPGRSAERVDKALVDAMIAEVDQRLSSQVNEILHHPQLQSLESSWRSLKFLVERTDFRENTRVEVLNASKQDLITDFEDAPEVVKSGLYRTVYSNEYGVFGGKPYGLVVGNFDVGPGPEDLSLLSKIASVAAMSHTPFVANASPEFFGQQESFLGLPALKDLKSLFEGPQYARWHSFRESEDARYVGLCMPRFLLRLPYSEKTVPVKAFNFTEDVVGHHERYLWGYASTAFASRVTDSFAKFRWCPNIIGPQAGGAVENLPLHQYEAMGEIQTKIPTEVLLTERREFELSEEGFIGLVFRKDTDNAAFFSANSAQKPKFFGNTPEGKAAETNYRLGTQLPYMFIMSRLAHYLKVLQREQIGSWKERADLERELNQWINQYVADMDEPAPSVRSRRPLRTARIKVEDVEGQPGWYRCNLQVRPHFKYMGAAFTLSLVGKLDKE
ncbi:type VI secretion system contractile sheath large subunit [Myxococcus landrumensis]|uniref:Type VI secretion system contractile sheath large subunit n=1 Tax=Myxococcus landrumensis TaxID=2813577 RepID=A0ABX7N8T1_9BACT|nr:type VI secretion system contractile sheath large subunit [Myxococcus landrumus]QSQ15048.1 type VI secretion system contractile sheath large subunit [Myxococcus landrumus]